MYCLDEYFFDRKIKIKNKIKFNRFVNTILIPNVNDYKNADLINTLWYTSTELLNFRNNSSKEVFELINRHKNMTIKQAAKLLYQPGTMNITYDINNFE
jgi:hypothetical protein